MQNRSLRLTAALSAAALAALPATAAQRTFVASFGLDTNNCSINAPCRTFTRALTQADANGEVIVLDSAGYGAFTITQSVSIIAPEGLYAGISVFPGQHGITINGAGIKVTLRGLMINGQGGDDGIRINNAGDIFIEKVTVANAGNDIVDAGVRINAAGARVFISDTTIRGSAGDGIKIDSNATVVVDRSRVEGNGFLGIFGNALGGRLVVNETLVARNSRQGIAAGSSSATSTTWEVTVARSTVEGSNNFGGAEFGGSNTTMRISFADNVVQGNAGPGIRVSAGNGSSLSASVAGNRIVGNADGVLLLANAGGTVTALVGNNQIAGNTNGVSLTADLGGTATGLVGDNQIVGNAGLGIVCSGEGSATVVASRNDLLGQVRGFRQLGNCGFTSMGNNAVEGNFVNSQGIIGNATLQ